MNSALLIVAVVAYQAPTAAVDGESRIAAATFGNPAALVAEQGGGKAAAVEKNQYLLFITDSFSDSGKC